MAMPFGLELEGEPLLYFSARQDVVIWPLQPAGASAAGLIPRNGGY